MFEEEGMSSRIGRGYELKLVIEMQIYAAWFDSVQLTVSMEKLH